MSTYKCKHVTIVDTDTTEQVYLYKFNHPQMASYLGLSQSILLKLHVYVSSTDICSENVDQCNEIFFIKVPLMFFS
jgi:hypothetical protein